jgi:hypothetical protein
MDQDRLSYGPLIATIGSALLAVSVFLPWYALSFTAAGIAFSEQQLQSVATQFGNSAFQSEVSNLHSKLGVLAGHPIGTVTAHAAFKYLSWVLLILAAVAFVSSLLRLARASQPAPVGAGQVALVGALATLCVLFRMVERPFSAEGFVSLSLSGGAWLALGSSLAITVGGLWPARSGPTGQPISQSAAVPEGLSGWTPEA